MKNEISRQVMLQMIDNQSIKVIDYHYFDYDLFCWYWHDRKLWIDAIGSNEDKPLLYFI